MHLRFSVRADHRSGECKSATSFIVSKTPLKTWVVQLAPFAVLETVNLEGMATEHGALSPCRLNTGLLIQFLRKVKTVQHEMVCGTSREEIKLVLGQFESFAGMVVYILTIKTIFVSDRTKGTFSKPRMFGIYSHMGSSLTKLSLPAMRLPTRFEQVFHLVTAKSRSNEGFCGVFSGPLAAIK